MTEPNTNVTTSLCSLGLATSPSPFSIPFLGHFGRFKGFQPNLTGSTQTPGALPRSRAGLCQQDGFVHRGAPDGYAGALRTAMN